MDYKKKYEKALANAREIVRNRDASSVWKDWLRNNFPELKESEDEKIRKDIISYIKSITNASNISPDQIKECKTWIAWLEKQGEQNDSDVIKDYNSIDPHFGKSIDKAEPKFKVGDWVVDEDNNCIHQIERVIENVTTNKFAYDLVEGGYFPSTKKNYHLWTIADAKDGDVISYNDGHGNNCIELIKSIVNKKIEFWFCLTNGEQYEVFDGIIPYTNLVSREGAIPATKEQRDLLFQKMKEAGYTFDFGKKELKEIEEEYDGEDYGIDSLWHAHRILEKTLGKVNGYQTDDGILAHKCAISAVKKLYEKKPAAWSEVDKNFMYDTLSNLTELKDRYGEGYGNVGMCIDWLKSLKDRVQPQSQTVWSEEDDYNVQCLVAKVVSDIQEGNIGRNQELIDWLKSLKPQNRWKPSEGQLQALKDACDEHWESDGLCPLYTLYEQLKQL